jgi:hypothetical protein
MNLLAIGSVGAGVALGITGVFVLAGPGWALIAGSVGCFGLAAALFRGMTNAQQTDAG